jgi:hypothetical protein
MEDPISGSRSAAATAATHLQILLQNRHSEDSVVQRQTDRERERETEQSHDTITFSAITIVAIIIIVTFILSSAHYTNQ